MNLFFSGADLSRFGPVSCASLSEHVPLFNPHSPRPQAPVLPMLPQPSRNASRVKPMLLSAAQRLHRLGLLAPLAQASCLGWRLSGRRLTLGKLAFWPCLMVEDLAGAEAITAHHRDRPRHRDWALRAEQALADRRPVCIDQLRTGLAPRRIGAGPPPDPGAPDLVYVLAGSLPQMQSGYAQRSDRLVRALRGIGLSVVCVTRPGFPQDVPGLAGPEPARSDPEAMEYHRIVAPSLQGISTLAYAEAASQTLEAFLRQTRPAAVMAASNHLTALPALMAARRLGLPFVYEVRGFWEITAASRIIGYDQSVRYRNAVTLESLIAQEADLVFTLNRPMRGELIRRGVAPAAIRLLPNGFDAAAFVPRPRDAALAAAQNLPAGVPVLGFAGSFTSYEGLDDLIAACGILARRGLNFRLVLVGDEPVYGYQRPQVLAGLRARIRAERLEDRVRLPGRVPGDEVPRWYSVFDIAPFPRKPLAVTELVPPLKPMEAMAMGKAVVVSDVGALTDFVQDGFTGLIFPKGDVPALAEALAKLITDPAQRVRLASAGQAWVVAERSWDRIAATLRDALPGRLQEHPAGAKHAASRQDHDHDGGDSTRA